MMQKSVDEVPVLIVGAGAGGLATAASLARYGVESLVVEKRAEVYRYPKARNLSFRSLEILRGMGLQDVVHAVSAGVPAMVVKPTLNSVDETPAIEMDTVFGGLAELSPEPTVQYCPQSRLEPILADYVRGRGGRVRYGTEMTSFKQDGTGVSATHRDRTSAQCTEVRARYVVAADGVHSPTRDELGVSTSGHGALPIYVIFIYFRASWRHLVPHLDEKAAVQVVNPDVNGIFIAADEDLGMFTITYFPDRGDTAEQFDEQRCRELLIAAVGEPIDVDIIEVAPWQPHELVADQFRCGRVFLVGDSAHAMPPFKAGGAERRHPKRRQSGVETRCGAARVGRRRTARHLRPRASAGRGFQRPPVADRAHGAAPRPRRTGSAPPGRRGAAHVRSARRLPVRLACGDHRGCTTIVIGRAAGLGAHRPAGHAGSACVGRRSRQTRVQLGPARSWIDSADRRRRCALAPLRRMRCGPRSRCGASDLAVRSSTRIMPGRTSRNCLPTGRCWSVPTGSSPRASTRPHSMPLRHCAKLSRPSWTWRRIRSPYRSSAGDSARGHPRRPVCGIDVGHVLHCVGVVDRQRRAVEHVSGERLQLIAV